MIAGVVFAITAATYAEGTARFPEAGGSASFARHAFDERLSFVAGWAQLLVYVVTISVSAFFVPHYLSIFWEPLNTNPWDIVGGAIVIVVLVALNTVGVQEADVDVALDPGDVHPGQAVRAVNDLDDLSWNRQAHAVAGPRS